MLYVTICLKICHFMVEVTVSVSRVARMGERPGHAHGRRGRRPRRRLAYFMPSHHVEHKSTEGRTCREGGRMAPAQVVTMPLHRRQSGVCTRVCTTAPACAQLPYELFRFPDGHVAPDAVCTSGMAPGAPWGAAIGHDARRKGHNGRRATTLTVRAEPGGVLTPEAP